MPRLALRPEEAAAALGLGKTKLYELTACGAIPSVKVDGLRLYPVESLREWLRRQSEEARP